MTNTKHPGDPRSNVFGEQPFDPDEYPGQYFTPPESPPVTPNVRGFVPYRGSEQHGVPFQESGKGFEPYLHEGLAHEHYVDANVTPRDIPPVKPVQVQMVSNPSLIEPRHIRFMSYNFATSATMQFYQVVQPERFRKRCVVTASDSNGGTATVRIANTGDASTPNSMIRVVPTGQDLVLLDAEVQSGLWIWPVSSTNSLIVVSVMLEYYTYDGASLGL